MYLGYLKDSFLFFATISLWLSLFMSNPRLAEGSVIMAKGVNGVRDLRLQRKDSESDNDLAPRAKLDLFQINDIRQALYYSHATYATTEEIQNWTCDRNCYQNLVKQTKISNIWSDKEFAVNGFLAYNSFTKTIVVAFRGSVDSGDWLDNFDGDFVDFPPDDSVPKWGEAHKGFTESSTWTYNYAKEGLRNLMNSQKDANILITGHSRGGAQAQLFAALFADEYPEWKSRTHLITFGQPRVGDEDLVKYMNKQGLATAWRVSTQKDLVPNVLPEIMGYRHAGQMLWIHETKESKLELLQCRPTIKVDESGCDYDGADLLIVGRREHSIYKYLNYTKTIFDEMRFGSMN